MIVVTKCTMPNVQTDAFPEKYLNYEEYRRLARHSPRAEANIVKACNTMQWSQKIS